MTQQRETCFKPFPCFLGRDEKSSVQQDLPGVRVVSDDRPACDVEQLIYIFF
jgi:hypothetical protein